MDRLKSFIDRYFINEKLSFDSRILNFVCLLGAIASLAALISRAIAGLPFYTMAPLLFMIVVISCTLFISAKGAKHASLLTTVIVCGVSIVFWPILFFTIGGPNSGMAVYFALAIILDYTLLKGKTRLFAILITIAVTVICYLSTLFWGWKALPESGLSTYQLFIDAMQSIFIVGFLMGVIILYQNRLYRDEKHKSEYAGEEIRHNEKLLTMINEAAVMLLTAGPDKFEAVLSESMMSIAVCLDIDCIDIWCVGERDGVPVYVQLYTWLSPDADSAKTIRAFTGSGILLRDAQWEDKLFGERGYISDHLSSFNGYIHEMLSACDIKVIMAFPVSLQGQYWGFVSFENRHSEKLCSEREAAILQSGSLLLINSVERNEKTLQLHQAQRTMSAMFEANPHMNILFDSNFKLMDCNPAAAVFFGFGSKEELFDGFIERMAKSIPQFQPDGRPSIPLANRLMTAAKEGFVSFETELHLANDMIRNLAVDFKRIPYEDSFAIVGYVYDMTDVYEREKELMRRDQLLVEAVEEAKAANLAKSNFLATMSHEIRTPMNAILGITEIQLQNERLELGIKEAFSKISVSGDMLLGIINDILDLSKIEAGKLELAIDKYEIASLISDTVQLNIMRIGSKPIEFELFVDEEMPALLLGDELRVKQIMNNILSNAFKYTTAGTVKLSVSARPCDDDESVTIVICVSDTGQGMTEEQIEKLFDEYSRFNMETNRSTEGTGLGMSITRNLLRLMHGEMIVDSEPGKGSTFTATIVQGKAGSGMLGKDLADNLHNFRTSSRAQMKRVQITREPMPYGSVLIVDDVEMNIYVAKGLLAPYELKIDTADSGFAAIEKIRNGNVYDVVFMDHMMPKMDGVEATRIIRDMGYKHPIVALTANAVLGQTDIFIGNGFDDFISKPIDIRQLNTILNKLIRNKRSPGIVETAEQKAEAKKDKPSGSAAKPRMNPRFAEIFSRDANKSLAVLSDITENGDLNNDDNDLQTYMIYVHGMKSALANIGQIELSAVAHDLEMSARNQDTETIIAHTPAFLDALRALVEELKPKNEPTGPAPENEDVQGLREKLLLIKAACEEFDEGIIEDTVTELRTKQLSQPAGELLRSVSEMLLHSEFDGITDAIDRFMRN